MGPISQECWSDLNPGRGMQLREDPLNGSLCPGDHLQLLQITNNAGPVAF